MITLKTARLGSDRRIISHAAQASHLPLHLCTSTSTTLDPQQALHDYTATGSTQVASDMGPSSNDAAVASQHQHAAVQSSPDDLVTQYLLERSTDFTKLVDILKQVAITLKPSQKPTGIGMTGQI